MWISHYITNVIPSFLLVKFKTTSYAIIAEIFVFFSKIMMSSRMGGIFLIVELISTRRRIPTR